MKFSESLTYRVQKTSTINTYAELWHAADCIYEKTETDKIGCVWQYLASPTLIAFAFEAYLNHIGNNLLDTWQQIGKSLNPMSKLELVCELLTLDVKKDEFVFCTLKKLFKFRNEVAHGKSQTISLDQTVTVKDIANVLNDRLLPNWYKLMLDDKFLKEAKHSVERQMTIIHDKQDVLDEPLFMLSNASHSASAVTS